MFSCLRRPPPGSEKKKRRKEKKSTSFVQRHIYFWQAGKEQKHVNRTLWCCHRRRQERVIYCGCAWLQELRLNECELALLFLRYFHFIADVFVVATCRIVEPSRRTDADEPSRRTEQTNRRRRTESSVFSSFVLFQKQTYRIVRHRMKDLQRECF